MTCPVIRVGLANPNSRMAALMEARNLPVMVSANSLFDHKANRFREVPIHLADLDVALDSAGFVAMSKYRRFPWSVAQYVDLAVMGGFTWWSQMDCCCEPEVAGDRDQVVARIHATAELLGLCREEYFRIVRETPAFADFSTPPMPILQGWDPEDYRLSADLADEVLGGDWPELVGIGSVCRRELNGPDGLWRVLHALDGVLPEQVRLHLFGVKGTALRGLRAHPRVLSVDSMAFELHARIEARNGQASKTTDFRIATMDRWLTRQVAHATWDDGQITLPI